MNIVKRVRIPMYISLCVLGFASICTGIWYFTRCPDTSDLEKLLNGNSSDVLESYSIVNSDNSVIISNKASVAYLQSQLSKSVYLGYAGSAKSKVDKHSHSILIRLYLRSQKVIDIYAHVVDRCGSVGLMLNYNLNCYDDPFAYWIFLAKPIDPILENIVNSMIMTHT